MVAYFFCYFVASDRLRHSASATPDFAGGRSPTTVGPLTTTNYKRYTLAPFFLFYLLLLLLFRCVGVVVNEDLIVCHGMRTAHATYDNK